MIFENYITCAQLLINSIGPDGFQIAKAISASLDPPHVTNDQLIENLENNLRPRSNVIIQQHGFLTCVNLTN